MQISKVHQTFQVTKVQRHANLKSTSYISSHKYQDMQISKVHHTFQVTSTKTSKSQRYIIHSKSQVYQDKQISKVHHTFQVTSTKTFGVLIALMEPQSLSVYILSGLVLETYTSELAVHVHLEIVLIELMWSWILYIRTSALGA